MICSQCKAEKSGERLPRGWKRKDVVYCDRCWHARYVLRAIAIPVVKPLGATWAEFRVAAKEAWAYSTQCANWMTDQFYARDVRRDAASGKMPAMPKIYLYPEATKLFPELPAASVAGMEQAIGGKYRATRHEVVWTHDRSLSTHRYPYPFSMPNQAWSAVYTTAGKEGGDQIPCVSVALLRGQRFNLQLKGGREFRRQLSAFDKIISGEAVKGELSLYRVRVHSGNGVTDRDSGEQKALYRVMVKMVAWLPRTYKTSESKAVLSVKSDVDALLVALDEKAERLWWIHADQVRRWTARHKRRLQRLADDHKHEWRPDAPFQSLREAVCEKQNNRIASFIAQTAHHLANFARRRGYGVVRYNDTERRYLPDFFWSGLKEKIRIKLNEQGIAMEDASAPMAAGSDVALAER